MKIYRETNHYNFQIQNQEFLAKNQDILFLPKSNIGLKCEQLQKQRQEFESIQYFCLSSIYSISEFQQEPRISKNKYLVKNDLELIEDPIDMNKSQQFERI
jgi:hypothetical protein